MRAFTAYRRAAYADSPAPRRQFMPREVMQEMLRQAGELLPLVDAPELDWALAERVHDPEYLRRWRLGEVTRAEERALGFAWTPQVPQRGLGSSGATFAATGDALATGFGFNFGGGTHHAYRDRAEGFSFLNDVAISAQWLLDTERARRVAILDFDVHQGNGTAHIFRDEPRILTVSLHGASNYPFQKEKSSLDINLPDDTTDTEYLQAMEQVTPVVNAFAPDFAYFLAGADVLAGDQLGHLALTLSGVRARDERVMRWARRMGMPLVTVLAGGYNADPQELMQARLGTVRAALEVFGRE